MGGMAYARVIHAPHRSDSVVTKERSLKQMLATVRKDKGKIEETIDQLDTYKQEALHKTWAQVNTYGGRGMTIWMYFELKQTHNPQQRLW